MKRMLFLSPALMVLTYVFLACNSQPKEEKTAEMEPAAPKWKEEEINFTSDNTTLNAYVVFNETDTNKRPAVLVVPEWWGLNDYVKRRARELAELGYVAMAIDMYGNGKTADNPDSAQAFAMPFYKNPQLAKDRIDAAIAKVKTYPETNPSQIGAIGYCFGGGMLLNTARLGDELKGVVSFHGSLLGTPANKDLLKTRILVCQGGADGFVPEADRVSFKKQMDSIGAVYTYKEYPGASHSFTNPGATEMGKKFNMPISYNPAADTASWSDMKVFFNSLFQ